MFVPVEIEAARLLPICCARANIQVGVLGAISGSGGLRAPLGCSKMTLKVQSISCSDLPSPLIHFTGSFVLFLHPSLACSLPIPSSALFTLSCSLFLPPPLACSLLIRATKCRNRSSAVECSALKNCSWEPMALLPRPGTGLLSGRTVASDSSGLRRGAAVASDSSSAGSSSRRLTSKTHSQSRSRCFSSCSKLPPLYSKSQSEYRP